MKPLLIVNPRSGGGATGRTWSSMRSAIENALGSCDVAMTERPIHGAEIACEGALAGRPLVVAVGGDGTFHEVVNGVMEARAKDAVRAEGASVALIGQGTGGDFRKTLEIEHRLDKYLDAIKSGRERRLDVGRFSGGGKASHYFVNILSAGMGGLVDQYVASAPRFLGGKAAYFGASFKALVNARLGKVKCTIERDGKTEVHAIRSFMIAICNGRYFGGGMKVGPMAEIDDGTFEVVALGSTTKLSFALRSNAIYSGAHMGQSDTVHLRGQKIKLELENTDAQSVYLLDVDGEPMGGLPLEVEVIPKALTLRA